MKLFLTGFVDMILFKSTLSVEDCPSGGLSGAECDVGGLVLMGSVQREIVHGKLSEANLSMGNHQIEIVHTGNWSRGLFFYGLCVVEAFERELSGGGKGVGGGGLTEEDELLRK